MCTLIVWEINVNGQQTKETKKKSGCLGMQAVGTFFPVSYDTSEDSGN